MDTPIFFPYRVENEEPEYAYRSYSLSARSIDELERTLNYHLTFGCNWRYIEERDSAIVPVDLFQGSKRITGGVHVSIEGKKVHIEGLLLQATEPNGRVIYGPSNSGIVIEHLQMCMDRRIERRAARIARKRIIRRMVKATLFSIGLCTLAMAGDDPYIYAMVNLPIAFTLITLSGAFKKTTEQNVIDYDHEYGNK